MTHYKEMHFADWLSQMNIVQYIAQSNWEFLHTIL